VLASFSCARPSCSTRSTSPAPSAPQAMRSTSSLWRSNSGVEDCVRFLDVVPWSEQEEATRRAEHPERHDYQIVSLAVVSSFGTHFARRRICGYKIKGRQHSRRLRYGALLRQGQASSASVLGGQQFVHSFSEHKELLSYSHQRLI
jgi:hypothetical protein